MDAVFHDVDRRPYRLAHGGDVKIKLIPRPSRLDLRAAGDKLLELMDIVGDPAPRLVLAEVVREVDVDGLSHSCDVARRSALFKPSHWSMVTTCAPCSAFCCPPRRRSPPS